jgi:hypothetical protein
VPHLQLAARARPGEEFPEDYLGEAEAGLGHYALAAEAYQQAAQRGHNSGPASPWSGFVPVSSSCVRRLRVPPRHADWQRTQHRVRKARCARAQSRCWRERLLLGWQAPQKPN